MARNQMDMRLGASFAAGGYNPEAALGAYMIDRIDPRRTDLIPVDDSKAVSITTAKLGLLLAQATPNSRALYLPTGLSGLPCFSFDGIDDWYRAESSPWPVDNVRVIRVVSIDTLITDPVAARYGINWGGVGLTVSISMGKIVASGENRLRGTLGNGSISNNVTGTLDASGIHIQDFKLAGSSQRHQVDARPAVLGAHPNGVTTGRTTYGSTNAATPSVFSQERGGDTFVLNAATPEPLIAQLKAWLKSEWGTA